MGRFNIGDRIESITSGQFQIVEILKDRKYRILFEDGYEKIVTERSLTNPEIKNPYAKTVCGVGWIGDEFENVNEMKEYRLWLSMIQRCYGKRESCYVNNGIEVCEEWKGYPNFSKWCRKQKGFYRDKWDLDKDLLIPGNKIYGPEFCCFLPRTINRTLILYSSDLGLSKGISLTKNGDWRINYYKIDSTHRSGKYFKILEDAIDFYNKNRFNLLRFIYKSEKDYLSDRAKDRLQEFL